MAADRELLDKIIAMQDKVFKAMEPLEAAGKVPADLRKAAENAKHWEKTVEGDFGNDESFREWPPKQLATKLRKHIGIFGNHEHTQLVQEYEELVGKLPYDADREHV